MPRTRRSFSDQFKAQVVRLHVVEEASEDFPERERVGGFHLRELHDEFLSPALVQAVRSRSSEALARVYRQVHPGVFVLDMLRPGFCNELLEEVACFENWCRYRGLPLIRPNTMNRYGTVLATLGFDPLLHELMTN